MKAFVTLILFLTFSPLFYAPEALADAARIEALELDLFKKDLHPFLTQNCVKCHGEKAVKPVGPPHSHSDSKLGFPEFKSRIDVFSMTEAKFWSEGTNQHHCNDFDYNCDKAQQVADDLKAKLLKYAEQVKKAIEAEQINSETAGFSIQDGQEVIEFETEDLGEGVSDAKLKVRMLRVNNADYAMLESLRLEAPVGMAFYIRGVQFLVNGQPVKNKTGFESLERVIFTNVKSRLSIAPYQPLIKIKHGQNLSIKVDEFREVSEVETQWCTGENFSAFKKFFLETEEMGPEGVSIHNLRYNLTAVLENPIHINDFKYCLELEALVNKRVVRRSPLFALPGMTLVEQKDISYQIMKLQENLPSKNVKQVSLNQNFYDDEIFELRKGRYLTRAAGCFNCHGSDLGGGVRFDLGSDGVFYSPNISANKQYGIGNWTEQEFIDALKTGKSPHQSRAGGGNYFPTFPYTSYAKMSDDDVQAIYNYIMRATDSSKESKEHELPFFVNRALMGVWKSINFNFPVSEKEDYFISSQGFQVINEKSDQWNRGSYLVNGVLHCAQCHSPRDMGFGKNKGKMLVYENSRFVWLSGSEMASGKKTGDITKTPSGEAWPVYSEEKFSSPAEYRAMFFKNLKDAGGKMEEVVNNSMRHLTADDLSAISEYLNSPDPLK